MVCFGRSSGWSQICQLPSTLCNVWSQPLPGFQVEIFWCGGLLVDHHHQLHKLQDGPKKSTASSNRVFHLAQPLFSPKLSNPFNLPLYPILVCNQTSSNDCAWHKAHTKFPLWEVFLGLFIRFMFWLPFRSSRQHTKYSLRIFFTTVCKLGWVEKERAAQKHPVASVVDPGFPWCQSNTPCHHHCFINENT